MRIWHEELIPLLCQKHLCAMWREGLGAYKIITENKKGYRNHPAVKEFEEGIYKLWIRLGKTREEMLARGYHPKELPAPPVVGDGIYPMWMLDKPWQTLEEQIQLLKQKGCKCKV